MILRNSGPRSQRCGLDARLYRDQRQCVGGAHRPDPADAPGIDAVVRAQPVDHRPPVGIHVVDAAAGAFPELEKKSARATSRVALPVRLSPCIGPSIEAKAMPCFPTNTAARR